MSYVIVCEGLIGIAVHTKREKAPVGQYLAWFDADAADGRGVATWTHSKEAAMRFPSPARAFSFWKTQSRVRPLREDGHPNRPLTAFTVGIERV